MGFSPDATLVYGFSYTFNYSLPNSRFLDEFEEYDEDFASDALYIFLKKRGLSFCEGGLSGNNDEVNGILGVEKNLTRYSYTTHVNLDELIKWEDIAKNRFNNTLINEVKEFLGIKEDIELKTYIVASVS